MPNNFLNVYLFESRENYHKTELFVYHRVICTLLLLPTSHIKLIFYVW